jgi:hypothetical protein
MLQIVLVGEWRGSRAVVCIRRLRIDRAIFLFYLAPLPILIATVG